jgi:hypothetical protein
MAMASVPDYIDDGDVPRAFRWHTPTGRWTRGSFMRCSRHRKNSSEGPMGVATECAAMASTMAMQQERGHCCPLHNVWWPAAGWDERALHAVVVSS